MTCLELTWRVPYNTLLFVFRRQRSRNVGMKLQNISLVRCFDWRERVLRTSLPLPGVMFSLLEERWSSRCAQCALTLTQVKRPGSDWQRVKGGTLLLPVKDTRSMYRYGIHVRYVVGGGKQKDQPLIPSATVGEDASDATTGDRPPTRTPLLLVGPNNFV